MCLIAIVIFAALLFAYWYACLRTENFYIPMNTVVGGADVAYTADLEPPENIPMYDITDFHDLPPEDVDVTSGMMN